MAEIKNLRWKLFKLWTKENQGWLWALLGFVTISLLACIYGSPITEIMMGTGALAAFIGAVWIIYEIIGPKEKEKD